MRAVVAEHTGPPSVLRVTDVAAREPGPREIRIAVEACGVCFHDVVVRNGTFRRGVGMPVILGHEVAGMVEKLGSEVRGLRSGRSSWPPRPTATSAAIAGIAAAATRPRARSASFSAMPGSMAAMPNWSVSMPMPPSKCRLASRRSRLAIVACTIGTELNAVRDVGRVRIGERVLVTGAGGGLGLHGVQLVAACGRLHHRGDDVAGQGGANPRGRRGRSHRRRARRGFFRRGSQAHRRTGRRCRDRQCRHAGVRVGAAQHRR